MRKFWENEGEFVKVWESFRGVWERFGDFLESVGKFKWFGRV